jgi:uncharacterized membrane-anchored protein
MKAQLHDSGLKVPAVTLGFWIIKVAATTLGETAGDALSMSLDLGYLVSTGIFALIFGVMVSFQISARRFHPLLYWTTIIATTTVGTTLADFVDRSLGIDYPGGSTLLLTLLLASLFFWYRSLGSIAVASITTPRAETWYWVTIMFSQTLGTALGDWSADTAGLGYDGGALLFGGMLLAIALAWRWTRLSRTGLFWAAFILTRPLGAVLGDFLDKPLDHGGLALDRFAASAVLLGLMGVCLLVFRQRAADSTH